MAVRNASESADMKAITLNKLTTKRRVKCLESPHYAWPSPLHNIVPITKTRILKVIQNDIYN